MGLCIMEANQDNLRHFQESLNFLLNSSHNSSVKLVNLGQFKLQYKVKSIQNSNALTQFAHKTKLQEDSFYLENSHKT